MGRRKAGDGLIRLRKDGRWEGRTVIGYDEKGLPKTKNVLAKTKHECQDKLDKLKAELNPEAVENHTARTTFGEWLGQWYKTYVKPTIRPGTQENYENRIYKHIIPSIGKMPITKLTQAELVRFYGELKSSGRLQYTEQLGAGLSNKMVRSCHALIKSALKKAVDEKLIKTNPADGCKLPSAQPKEMQILTPEEMQRFLIQAKHDGYYEIFLVALATGLRRGELMALQWSDINFKIGELKIRRSVRRTNGELLVSEPKTNAGYRTIILPPGVLKVLAEYKKTISSRWMFPSPVKEDSPRDPSTLAAKMKLVLERANCKIVRMHDLRHTFCAMSLEHGMDIKTLSEIIGHESAATTLNIYAHVTDAMQAQAARIIDKGIAGNDVPTDEPERIPIPPSDFKAVESRKVGYVKQLSPNCWQGRYSPRLSDGTRFVKNVYAPTEAECREKLTELIEQMRAEIAAGKTA